MIGSVIWHNIMLYSLDSLTRPPRIIKPLLVTLEELERTTVPRDMLRQGVHIKYLPLYSLDFQPIEEALSILFDK
jgi:hypothetical protein